jgi:Ca2+-binding EF-hand superfamily protein
VLLLRFDQKLEAKYREIFARYDTDGNGQLGRKEFRKFLEEASIWNLTEYAFDIVDSDHSGGVSFEEFFRFARADEDRVHVSRREADSSPRKADDRRFFNMVFDSCDMGKKGALTRSEFFRFMKYIGRPVRFFNRKKTFNQCDVDRNGSIDLEEILIYLDDIDRGIQRKPQPTH